MKSRINITIVTLFLLALLSACEQDIAMETTVHPDGSLDKMIHIASGGSFQNIQEVHREFDKATIVTDDDSPQTILGLSVADGWALTTRKIRADSSAEGDPKTIYTFLRHFSSAEEANAALATPSDTLFRVTSTFDKKFRWFYTYIYYADTYHAINRMGYPVTNYATAEDYAFIDRLPGEGKKITLADSLYLVRLNEKLFDVYGARALYEEYYNISIQLLKHHHVEQQWFDTLQAHKESLYTEVINKKDIFGDYMAHVIDSLGIPISHEEALKWYIPKLKPMDAKFAFISVASNTKYHHQINMPWDIVRTNADSISGNQVFWDPPSIKFLLKDYTFYAESRQLNYWAVAISGVVIVLTVFLFVRRRRV
jgi:hypothetical protein